MKTQFQPCPVWEQLVERDEEKEDLVVYSVPSKLLASSKER